MSEPVATGRCLCGRISYRVTGPAVWSGYCHCRSCRRFTGSVVTSWLGIGEQDLAFDGEAPASYVDGGVTRGFCANCGSSLTYASTRFPNYIQLHLGSLDDPGIARPLAHVHHAEKVAWFEVADELPRYPASAADDGGSWEKA